jgi:hypothetical protein
MIMSSVLAKANRTHQWTAVSGSDYWEFEGETLAARRLRFKDEQV